jgi:hypothetical protein
MKSLHRFLLPLLVIGHWSLVIGQPRCAVPLAFTPVNVPVRVEWSKFPAFSLPAAFTVVYGAPRFAGDANGPITRGFNRVRELRAGEPGAPQQRAIEWSGFAFGLGQPWETLESPWGNNLTTYRARWEQWLREHSGGQTNAAGQYILPADVLMVDIERKIDTDAAILLLKTNPATPAIYRALPDAEFVRTYKRDMTNLYAEGLRYIRQRADLSRTLVSTYSDVPIRNTYLNVVANPWADWTTNAARVSYLTKDSTGTRLGGPFYDQLSALIPSVYYYYDYGDPARPNPLAGDFLAYTLFQIEANRAWSNKPVIPIVWLRFHNAFSDFPRQLPRHMAEATAIFPFLAGAKGLWLWDEGNLAERQQDALVAYEYFIHGLYRLSQFSETLAGSYELIAETNPRDLMNDRKPVWRAIFANNKLLVAAHNPYASETQTTNVPIRYKTWQGSITLTGREVALCQYDLSLLGTAPIEAFRTYPNPATTQLTVELTTPGDVQLIDLQGRILRQYVNISSPLVIDTSTLPAGLYLVRSGGVTKQIVKN